MTKRFTFLLLATLFSVSLFSQQPVVNFSALETSIDVITQGFDSQEEMTEWQLVSTNQTNTWMLGNPRATGQQNFSSINPTSKNSLSIRYDDRTSQDEKAISPEFLVKSGMSLGFYAMFDGVFSMYAPLTVETVNTATNEVEVIFNSFTWSNDNGHERPKWLSFNFSLDKYVGQKIQIIFKYKGKGGDDVLIDDFKITQKDDSENAKVYIQEEGFVHFIDNSSNAPTSWNWSFEGGEPLTSTEKDPIVKYNNAGTYSVTLTVTNESGSASVTRNGFVVVQGVAPVASFLFPAEGYKSPQAAVFVPLNVPVVYKDNSKNRPTAWLWNLPGTALESYTEQNPSVVYTTEGTYNVDLTVQNNQGSDVVNWVQAVKAGGKLPIWNIEMEESSSINEIAMGWYGFYGGSNWLDIYGFAEKFKKPSAPITIDKIDVYFMSTKTVGEPVDIKLSIMSEKDNLPGEILASTTLSSSELVKAGADWTPTVFSLNEPLTLTDAFYIALEGFPNRTDDATYESDEIVMGAVRRKSGSVTESTVYHLLSELDDRYQPIGEPSWVKNADENVSFAIAPHASYTMEHSTGNTENKINEFKITGFDDFIRVKSKTTTFVVSIYSISGALIKQVHSTGNEIDIKISNKGVYILKVEDENSVQTAKILLK